MDKPIKVEKTTKEGWKVAVQVDQQLEMAADEGLRYLIKAFRGGVDMEETSVRATVGAAGSVVGAWSRYQATKSQREQTELLRAGIFARDLGGKATDYLADVPRKALEEGS